MMRKRGPWCRRVVSAITSLAMVWSLTPAAALAEAGQPPAEAGALEESVDQGGSGAPDQEQRETVVVQGEVDPGDAEEPLGSPDPSTQNVSPEGWDDPGDQDVPGPTDSTEPASPQADGTDEDGDGQVDDPTTPGEQSVEAGGEEEQSQTAEQPALSIAGDDMQETGSSRSADGEAGDVAPDLSPDTTNDGNPEEEGLSEEAPERKTLVASAIEEIRSAPALAQAISEADRESAGLRVLFDATVACLDLGTEEQRGEVYRALSESGEGLAVSSLGHLGELYATATTDDERLDVFVSLAQELGVEHVVVRDDSGHAWVMARSGGAWGHVDALAASHAIGDLVATWASGSNGDQTAQEIRANREEVDHAAHAWLFVSDEAMGLLDGSRGEWRLVDGEEAPVAVGAEEGVLATSPGTDSDVEKLREREASHPTLPPGSTELGIEIPSVHDANESGGLIIQDAIPSAYDSASFGRVTPVRNQNPFGTCWAFAGIAAVESSMLAHGMDMGYDNQSLDLSERHLSYFAFNTPGDPLGNTSGDATIPVSTSFASGSYDNEASYLNNGGNSYSVALTLASRIGAASEEAAPYDALVSEYYQARWSDPGVSYSQFLSSTALDPGIARNNVSHLRQAQWIPMRDRDDVKQAIMKYGALSVDMCYEAEYCRYGSYDQPVYYFYDGESESNHTVSIVGWDDSVGPDSFGGTGANVKPKGSGAWLCKNSWGVFDSNGYFWISYEDTCVSTSSATAFLMGDADSTENIYQYDGSNATSYSSIKSGGSIANVYTAAAGSKGERLTSVVFGLNDVNVSYSVQIYLDPTDATNPASGVAALSKPVTGKTTYAGLYTVDLPTAIDLLPGTRYSVVITLQHEGDGSEVNYMMDCNYETKFYRFVNNVKAGQSFARDGATAAWGDLVTNNSDFMSSPGTTARIKAYTKNADLSGLMNVEKASVAAIAERGYTGSALQPNPAVRIAGHLLRSGTDYTLSYKNNVNAGTATVTITGKGRYAGTKTVSFTILKAGNTLLASPRAATQTVTYSASAAAKAAANVAVSKAQGAVTYANASTGATAKKFSVDKSTGAVTVPKGTVAGTYAVAVKATAAGDANHKAGSKTASFKVTVAKAASTIKLAAQSKTYTGKALAYNGKVTKSGSTGKVTYKYYSDAKCTKAVKAANVKAARTYYVKATVAADANHKAATSAAVKFTIAKAANPVTVKATSKSASLKTLKSKSVTVAPLAVSKAQGKVTYAKASGSSALTVNKTTGKVTVKKGTKKGTYTAKVKITAAGNANHKAGSKTVTVKVAVK